MVQPCSTWSGIAYLLEVFNAPFTFWSEALYFCHRFLMIQLSSRQRVAIWAGFVSSVIFSTGLLYILSDLQQACYDFLWISQQFCSFLWWASSFSSSFATSTNPAQPYEFLSIPIPIHLSRASSRFLWGSTSEWASRKLHECLAGSCWPYL